MISTVPRLCNVSEYCGGPATAMAKISPLPTICVSPVRVSSWLMNTSPLVPVALTVSAPPLVSSETASPSSWMHDPLPLPPHRMLPLPDATAGPGAKMCTAPPWVTMSPW
jgi:hypothetical protein